MSNKASPVVFMAIFVLSGEVIGEAPRQSGRPAAPEPIPGIARMNPYYLGISAAVLANDTKTLSGYVTDLEKVASSHAEVWLDAMCARLYVLEKLDDRAKFSQAMAQLCAHKLSDERSAKRRLKFVNTTLLTLRLNHKTEWVERASDAIWPVLGPEPDPLLALILRDRLGRMPRYAEKAKLLAEVLKKASKTLKEASSSHPLRAYWNSGMEELYYLSIRNHFVGIKIDPLSSEVAVYLDRFGKDNRRAAEVFYLLLKALNIYYTQLAKSAPLLNKSPDADWLQRWQRIFAAQKGGIWTKRILDEWAKWENGERSRDELAHQPRKNPKLQARLSFNLKKPQVKEILNRLNTATGLHFTVAENIPEDRVVCGSLYMHEVPAWSVMDQLKQAVVSEGLWKTETKGYQLIGNLKPPIEDAKVSPINTRPSTRLRASSNRRRLLAVGLALLMLFTFLALLRWRMLRSGH